MGRRRGEQANVKINVFRSKKTSISIWESLTKRGKSTVANGWGRQRTFVVSLDGAANVFGTSARIV
jgi:hypothetical protein